MTLFKNARPTQQTRCAAITPPQPIAVQTNILAVAVDSTGGVKKETDGNATTTEYRMEKTTLLFIRSPTMNLNVAKHIGIAITSWKKDTCTAPTVPNVDQNTIGTCHGDRTGTNRPMNCTANAVRCVDHSFETSCGIFTDIDGPVSFLFFQWPPNISIGSQL